MHALGIAEGMYENGYDVDFIGGRGLAKFKDDLPDNVNIIEISEKASNFIGALFWYIRFGFVVYSLMFKNKYDIYISRYVISSFFFMILSTFISRETVKVIEVNTFAFHVFLVKKSFLNRLVARLEVFVINRFDIFYAVSNSMAVDERLQGLKSETVVIPNGSSKKQIELRKVDRYSSNIRLIYLGSIMHYWDYTPLIRAIRDSKHAYEMHFVGAGPFETLLREEFKGDTKVHFHGEFNRNDLSSILNAETDILFMPPIAKNELKRTGGLSTKAFDYLSMKLPIIGPADGELLNVYRHKKNAILYNREDFSSINRAIELLVLDSQLRSSISNNAYFDFLNNYSWRSRMKMLIDKVDGIKK